MGLKPRPQILSFYLGDGISLRPPRLADAPALFQVVDANRARLREWMPWVDTRGTPADIEGFIAATLAQHASGTALRQLIEVGGEISGVISIESIDKEHRKASIGYWIDGVCEGRGIVSRSVIALCDHGFRTLGLHRIEIHCGTENWRSQRVPVRLGFVREGVLRECEWVNDRFVDHVVFAMLAADWP